ncbi:MAG TPA: MG2 domain-containing protein [Candidatus Acidoferrales bacterium]|nr:MG2 domain-containing protein [Candidatus Acidoferrales bacterium]
MVIALAQTAPPVRAARPLLDTHKLDGVFALYARDVMVPWKDVVVRLDTYSGAPVDFSAYEVDPADVLIAGSSRMHAIDTSRAHAVARWKFTPPPGYRFESNDVNVPLGNHEGFFVIEARRGEASQQTWINLTRIGLVTKETPEGWILYGTDLRTGQPLAGMRVTLLVGGRFVEIKTGADGIARGVPGARFALAEWGRSKAFVSLTPQPPLPLAIVGVRADRGVVRAGETLRVVGFARKRDGATFKPMHGDVHVSALLNGRTVGSTTFQMDPSGGFWGALPIPQDTAAGELAIIATAGGGTGGTTVHVDAAGDYTLSVAALCGASCSASSAVPLRVSLRSQGNPVAGQVVQVRVVRTPHVLAPGESPDIPRWGTTTIQNTSVRTTADGTALVTLRAPTDGLSSTYGVVASTQSATATTQIVVPNAPTVVAITPDDSQLDVGQAAVFDVHGFDATDGRPAAGRQVRVVLTKGPNASDVTVTLDSLGHAQATFRSTELGTNIATAQFVDNPAAMDATAVTVAPGALGARLASRSADITLTLDKSRYKLSDHIDVNATLSGAYGSALFTVEGARIADTRVASASGGHAAARLSLANAQGTVRIGVAFVKDGAVYTSDFPVAIDGPGYPRVTALTADHGDYAPGATAHISIQDGGEQSAGLLAVRVSDGRPSAGASFDNAPAILAAGGTTTQDPASTDPSWHAYVAPAGSKAQDIFGGDNTRTVAAPDNSLAVSAPHAIVWRVGQSDGDAFNVDLPTQRGRYVVSVLKISDDGDVGAASLAVSVQ